MTIQGKEGRPSTSDLLFPYKMDVRSHVSGRMRTYSATDLKYFYLCGQQREETPRTAKQCEKFSTKNSGKFFQGKSIMEHENEAAENTK